MVFDTPREFLGLEWRRVVRDRSSHVALGLFVLVAGIGAWLYWNALPPRPPGSRLFGEAYVLALVVGGHVGLARDRAVRFDAFLISNFVTPAHYYVTRVVIAVMTLTAFAAIAFAIALVLSFGDLAYAAEYAATLYFASLMALPAIVILELFLNSRHTVAILLIGLVVTMTLYGRANDPRPVLRALGLSGELDVWASLFRSGIALTISIAFYPLFRWRIGRYSLAGVGADP
jgi:hypothetical protein